MLGVDGCPGGWVGARVELSSLSVRWLMMGTAAEILEVDAVAVGIDIPMGLPSGGPRRCDALARRALPGRASCVFDAPVRDVLAASDYADARRRSVAASRRSLSAQSWHLVPRIADVDAALTPRMQDRVVEVHPELSFAAMAGEVLTSKRRAGIEARLDALSRWLPDAEGALARAPRPARADDALDALAAAWSAARWSSGTARVLPGASDRDDRGLLMQIVT